MKHKLITIEGGEGCGKSTLIEGLKACFEKENLPLHCSREPGGTELGGHIRSLFHEPPKDEILSAQTELLLISAARTHHIQNIILPKLGQGIWVLLDRYYDSSCVYQSEALKGLINDSQWTEFTVGNAKPGLTILCDLPVEVSLNRLNVRNESETLSRMDKKEKEFHEEIRSKFKRRAEDEPDRIKTIDASLPPEDVLNQAWDVISTFRSQLEVDGVV